MAAGNVSCVHFSFFSFPVKDRKRKFTIIAFCDSRFSGITVEDCRWHFRCVANKFTILHQISFGICIPKLLKLVHVD